MAESRHEALKRWLGEHPEVAGLPLEPASGDASFRRYFRLRTSGRSWIVMDAPPPMEDCRPFIQVAAMLRSLSLNVPEIIDADLQHGFLLMSDLGSRQYLDALREDAASADRLYPDALVALRRMQVAGAPERSSLPVYDERLLREELTLFRDWLCVRHLGLDWDAERETGWQAVVGLLVGEALAQPRVLVHRDYHSRNLMVCDDNSPGILDFQDAVVGPLTYDLVSLLKDCYIRWPSDVVRGYALQHLASLQPDITGVDEDHYWRWFQWMGAQRHLKAAGIFARLKHRDGKEGYMPDVPRTLRYIVEVAANYPELDFLHALVAEHCLPRFELGQ